MTVAPSATQVIADVAAAQRREWAEHVLAGRDTLWLDGSDDALATLARKLDADALPGAVGWVTGVERADSLDAAERVLRDVVERGVALVVAIPNPRLEAAFASPRARELGWDEARALAAALGAELVEQHLAETAVIGTPGDGPLEGALVGAPPESDDAS